MTLKVDGNAYSAGEVQPKTVAIKNLNMYTTKSDGYVRWLAGHIVVNGVEYAVSASNSGASKTDKLIVATLTDGANTAAISFIATNTTITDNNKVLLGYVDATSRLTLLSASAQPDFSGYTLTKSNADVNVVGEGYFMSADCWAFALSQPFGAGNSTATANARAQVSIDGSAIADENYSHSMTTTSNGSAIVCHSEAHVNFLMKFQANLVVTFTLTASTVNGSQTTTNTGQVCFYWVK